MSKRVKHGFTLVELIVVIVLIGILAVGGSQFIILPFEAFQDIERRQEITDSIEMTFRRMSRDIQRGLPNSLRLSCVDAADMVIACDSVDVERTSIEVMNTLDGARYRDETGGGFTDLDDVLDFTTDDAEFNVFGTFNNLTPGSISTDARIAIYNTTEDIYLSALSDANPSIVSPSTTTLSLANDTTEQKLTLSTAHQFLLESPSQRLFIIDNSVVYICDEDSEQITRHIGNGFEEFAVAQNSIGELTANGYSNALVSQNVTNCEFSYDAGSSTRTGLVSINIEITLDDETANLLHQIHVFNAP